MTKLYNYTPKEDLSVHELSDIMRSMFVSLIEGIQGQPVLGKEPLQIDDIVYNNLSNHLRRHFSELPPVSNTDSKG